MPASTPTTGPSAWNCSSAKAAGSTVPRIEPMVGMKLRKKIAVGQEERVVEPDEPQHGVAQHRGQRADDAS